LKCSFSIVFKLSFSHTAYFKEPVVWFNRF